MSGTISRKRETPFSADRRTSASARTGRDVAPRLQHHDERARKNHRHHRSSPAKDENSHSRERRRIRLGDPLAWRLTLPPWKSDSSVTFAVKRTHLNDCLHQYQYENYKLDTRSRFSLLQ